MHIRNLSGKSRGWIAVVISVAMWVAFAISTRAIAYSSLTNIDVALLRFSIPVVLLCLTIPRAWGQVRQAPLIPTMAMVIGGGLPFFLLIAKGGERTSATLVGVVNQGLPPMFVAIIGYLVWRNRLSKSALIGHTSLLAGVLLLVISLPESMGFISAVLLGASALFWALYSIGLEYTQLEPSVGVLLISLPSAIVAILLAILVPGASALMEASGRDIVGFALIQGLGGGLVSLLAYNIAVTSLGARTTATVCAISPALTAVLAIPIFGEAVSWGGAIGIGLVVAGIVYANAK